MKTLYFTIRGELYKVKENGDMIQTDNTYNKWNDSWRLLGVSTHHMQRHATITVKELFENPKRMIKGYLWDKDHGTKRLWGGKYYGKLPRVTQAFVEEELEDVKAIAKSLRLQQGFYGRIYEELDNFSKQSDHQKNYPLTM